MLIHPPFQVFIPETGHGVEGASSHCLGQTYAKTFNILFEDKNGEKAMVWQTSWDLNTTAVNEFLLSPSLTLPSQIRFFSYSVSWFFFSVSDWADAYDSWR